MVILAIVLFLPLFIWIAFFHEYDADGTIQNNKRARRKRNRDNRK